MRFYAAFVVERPHDFALAVLQGQHVRKIKDRNGKMMTDAYLAQKLGQEFPWVPRVYERTSGYVHLSSTHLFSAATELLLRYVHGWVFTKANPELIQRREQGRPEEKQGD